MNIILKWLEDSKMLFGTDRKLSKFKEFSLNFKFQNKTINFTKSYKYLGNASLLSGVCGFNQ